MSEMLFELRRVRQLSQVRFAALLGISVRRLRRFEHNELVPTDIEAKGWAALLDLGKDSERFIRATGRYDNDGCACAVAAEG